MNLAGDPVRRLLDEGDALLAQGRAAEAALAFERVLLQDAAQPDARRGLEQARRAVTEALRRSEARLDEAEGALDAGEWDAARAHLEAALADGPGGPRALAMLDRLDRRSGRVAAPTPPGAVSPEVKAVLRRPHWSRRAFVAACAAGFACLAVGVAASWDDLLGRLTRAPRPSALPAPPTLGGAPTDAMRAVADAQRRLERGDPAGARAVLDRVRPEDPLYPYAQQLRQRTETARRAGDAR